MLFLQQTVVNGCLYVLKIFMHWKRVSCSTLDVPMCISLAFKALLIYGRLLSVFRQSKIMFRKILCGHFNFFNQFELLCRVNFIWRHSSSCHNLQSSILACCTIWVPLFMVYYLSGVSATVCAGFLML